MVEVAVTTHLGNWLQEVITKRFQDDTATETESNISSELHTI